MARFARTTGRPTPNPESELRPRVPRDTIPSRPDFPRRNSPSSLQAAMMRMLDRVPQGTGVNVLALLDRVPHLRMKPDQVRRLALDHLAGFVLALVDGTMTVSTILDLCAMPQDGALAILTALFDGGVIACSD
jgi:hypothetical protein